MSEVDHPEPEELEEMSEEEIEEFNQRTSERLQQAIEEETTGLTAEEEEAFNALMQAEEERRETAVVELADDVEVEVLKHIPGNVEDRFEQMNKVAEEQPSEARRLLAESIAEMIVDDDYSNSYVWLQYARRYGNQKLMEMFNRVAEPASQEVEELRKEMKSFR